MVTHEDLVGAGYEFCDLGDEKLYCKSIFINQNTCVTIDVKLAKMFGISTPIASVYLIDKDRRTMELIFYGKTMTLIGHVEEFFLETCQKILGE